MSRYPASLIALVLPLILGGCAETRERPAPERRSSQPESAEPRAQTKLAQEQPATPDAKPPPEPAGQTESRKRAISISLESQSFVYSEDGETVRTGPISSGAPGYPTPTGHFSVLSKDENKVSTRYTNQLGMQAWMPYSIQFHGNYFLHEGWLPGYPDSHGCVRVGEPDARFLFERLQIGDPVTLTD